jgi:serine/tyrosine/threonine adenylyltransferase
VMGVGFIHGVMNTDNMALSGETIDYGPCAFMEGYAPGTVFSSIDHQGRYAYANQPLILGWNLARLAETLLPFFAAEAERAVEIANARLAGIAAIYQAEWLAVMRAKLGLLGEDAGDAALAEDFLGLIEGADWTLAFHRLGSGDTGLIKDQSGLQAWVERWQARRGAGWQARMAAANPSVIPRNHLVEQALSAATAGDMAPFEALLAAVRAPFGPVAGREAFALPAPSGFGPYLTYCGT